METKNSKKDLTPPDAKPMLAAGVNVSALNEMHGLEYFGSVPFAPNASKCVGFRIFNKLALSTVKFKLI